MPTAFVTGATGFVGINLVRELLAERWRVVALHRSGSDSTHLAGAEFVEGDILDAESLRRAMPDGVDVVFHVAGDTTLWSRNRDRQMRVNVIGTRNVVETAIEKRVRRLVQTSSIAAYGHHDVRVNESTASTALDSPIHYARTKRLAEIEVERGIALGLDAVLVNPSHIVGPYDASNWSRMIRLVRDEKLPGVPPGGGSWCHVREVVRAHIAAAERGKRGDHYLLGGTDATFLEAVKTIGKITSRKVPDKTMKPFLLHAYGTVSEWVSLITGREPDVTREGAILVCENVVADCSKAERELGYKAVPLRTMFQDCYEWMIENDEWRKYE